MYVDRNNIVMGIYFYNQPQGIKTNWKFQNKKKTTEILQRKSTSNCYHSSNYTQSLFCYPQIKVRQKELYNINVSWFKIL